MEHFIDNHIDKEQKMKKRRVSSSQGSTKKTEVTDFELLKKIGQGGFGEVYLCRKRDTKEVLALKIIDKTFVWAQNKVITLLFKEIFFLHLPKHELINF